MKLSGALKLHSSLIFKTLLIPSVISPESLFLPHFSSSFTFFTLLSKAAKLKEMHPSTTALRANTRQLWARRERKAAYVTRTELSYLGLSLVVYLVPLPPASVNTKGRN